jgi:hypothetical protein
MSEPTLSATSEVPSFTSPKSREDIYASPEYQDLFTPKVQVGDLAPDFELPQLDASHRTTGETTRLSAHFGHQPVALIFGSYT